MVLGTLVLTLLGAPSTTGRVVSVAAAADLRFAMDQLVGTFQKTHPGVFIKASFGASGVFYAQLQNGAPFDLFFSADLDYPRRLKDAGLAEEVSIYGAGHLVLWVRNDFPLPITGLELLKSDLVKHVAIANPENAPYGKAAETALRKLRLLEAVRPKLVLGQNVTQAAQFAESGAADAALIALSVALAPELQKEGRFVAVPESGPIEQGVILLKHSREREAAEAFQQFVLGGEGKGILKQFGLAPEE